MKIERPLVRAFIALSLIACSDLSATAASISILHHFALGGTGSSPHDAPVIDGNQLYGVVGSGGANSGGAIYALNNDGSNYHLLTSFVSGSFPASGLVRSGSILYGTAPGGNLGRGVVYKVNNDGTGFTNLRSFGPNPLRNPQAALTLSGTDLYGTTNGNDNAETQPFAIRLSTSGTLTALHRFIGGAADVYAPSNAALVVSGSTVFGLTIQQDVNNLGKLYSVSTTGTNFSLLHTFNGGPSDGGSGAAGLVQVGAKLYGTTAVGGTQNSGVLFSINTDGTNFELLHSFTGTGAGLDGKPTTLGNLIAIGSKLYGVTSDGGDFNFGTIYSMNADGSQFHSIFSFAGGVDGKTPNGTLSTDGLTLYGVTSSGGTANAGVLYSLIIPEPGSIVLAAFGFAALVFCGARARGQR